MVQTKKIIKILSVVLLLILLMTTNVFADDLSGLGKVTSPSSSGIFERIGGAVLNVIYTVAVVVSVGMIMIIGIKYMTASPEQKGSLKERAIPFLIGGVLVFGTANILKFISTMASWIE